MTSRSDAIATVTHVRLANPGLLCTVHLTCDGEADTTADVAVRLVEGLRGDEVADTYVVRGSHLSDDQERAAIEAVSESYAVEREIKGGK